MHSGREKRRTNDTYLYVHACIIHIAAAVDEKTSLGPKQ